MLSGDYLASAAGLDYLEFATLEQLRAAAFSPPNATAPQAYFPPARPPPCLYAPPPHTSRALLCTLPGGVYGGALAVRASVRGLLTAWVAGVSDAPPRLAAVTVGGAGGSGGFVATAQRSGSGAAEGMPPGGWTLWSAAAGPGSSSEAAPAALLSLAGGALLTVSGYGLHPCGALSATFGRGAGSAGGGVPAPPLACLPSPAQPFPAAAVLAALAAAPGYAQLDNASLAASLSTLLGSAHAAWLPGAAESVLVAAPAWLGGGGAAPFQLLRAPPPPSAAPPQSTAALHNASVVYSLQAPREAPFGLSFVGGSGGGADWPPAGDGGSAARGLIFVGAAGGLGELGGSVLVAYGDPAAPGAPAPSPALNALECPMLWNASLAIQGAPPAPALLALLPHSSGAAPGESAAVAAQCPGLPAPAIAVLALRLPGGGGGDGALAALLAALPASSDAACGTPSAPHFFCAGVPSEGEAEGGAVLCLTAASAASPRDMAALRRMLEGGGGGGGGAVYLAAAPLAPPPPGPRMLSAPRAWRQLPPGAALPCAVHAGRGSGGGGGGVVGVSRPPGWGLVRLALLREGNASLSSAGSGGGSGGSGSGSGGSGSGSGSGILVAQYAAPVFASLTPSIGRAGGEALVAAGANFGLGASPCAVWNASGARALAPCPPLLAALPPFSLLFTQPEATPGVARACAIAAWAPTAIACAAPPGVPGSSASALLLALSPAAALAAASVGASLASAFGPFPLPQRYAYAPAALSSVASPGALAPPGGGFELVLAGRDLLAPPAGWDGAVVLSAGAAGGGSVMGGGAGSSLAVSASAVRFSGGSLALRVPPATPAVPAVLEGALAVTLLYFPLGSTSASASAVRVGPLPLQAAPPANLALSELLAGNGTGCGPVPPSAGPAAALPCLHVSALSPAAPLTVQLAGSFLGAASPALAATLTGYTATTVVVSSVAAASAAAGAPGAPGAATSVTSVTPIALNCTPLRLYAAATLTCAVTAPLPRGSLTFTLLNLASSATPLALPALGACASGHYADADGEFCRPCPPGAACAGGLDTARALPGFWRATAAAAAEPSAAAAFLPCPVPSLCAGNGECVGGTWGPACTACPAGAVMVTGALCVPCGTSPSASLASFAGACVGAALAAAGVVGGALWSRRFGEGGGSGSSSSGVLQGGASPLPLLPLFTILASPLHALVALASFYTPVLQAQGVAGAVAPSAAALGSGGGDALLATLAALKAVRDLGTSTAAAACLFSPSMGQRALAVTLLPLLLCGGIYAAAAGCFLAGRCCWRAAPGGAAAASPLSALLTSKAPEQLLLEEGAGAGAGAEAAGAADPAPAAVASSASAALGLPSTVGAMLATFRARLAALEGEVAAREQRLSAMAGHLTRVRGAALAAAAAAAAAAGAPRAPDTLHGAWLESGHRAAGAYVSALVLVLLLPQTLLFSFAWLQCAPGGAGGAAGYVLEEPGLLCSDAGYAAWALPLRLVPLYLLLPVAAMAYQLCGSARASPASSAPAPAPARAAYPTATLAALQVGYRAELPLARAWECALLLRKVAFAAMATGWLGVGAPLSRVTGCAGIALGALAAQLLVRPYASASANALEALGLTLSLVWTLALLPRVQSGTGRLAGLDAVGFALGLVMGAAWLALVCDTVCARGVGNAWVEVELREWLGGRSGSGSGSGSDGGAAGEEGRALPPKGKPPGAVAGEVATANPLLGLPEQSVSNPVLAASSSAAAAAAAAAASPAPPAPPPASPAASGALAIRALPSAVEVWTPPPFAGLGSPLLVLGRGSAPRSSGAGSAASRTVSASSPGAPAASPLSQQQQQATPGSAGAAGTPRQAALAALYASPHVLRLAKTFGVLPGTPVAAAAAEAPAAAATVEMPLAAPAVATIRGGSPRRPAHVALGVEGGGGAGGSSPGARAPGAPAPSGAPAAKAASDEWE